MKEYSHSLSKLGDMFAIALHAGEYGYARRYRGSSIGVIPVISAGIVDGLEKLTTSTPRWYFNFVVPLSDDIALIKIGEIRFENVDEAWPPPRFIPPDIFKNFFQILERGQRRRATEAEAKGLQQVKTLTPESLREFICSHSSECLRQQGSDKEIKIEKAARPAHAQRQTIFLEIVFQNRDCDFNVRDAAEEALLIALPQASVGEVTGGGGGGGKGNVDIEVSDLKRGLEIVRQTLKAIKAPASTVINQYSPDRVVHRVYDESE